MEGKKREREKPQGGFTHFNTIEIAGLFMSMSLLCLHSLNLSQPQIVSKYTSLLFPGPYPHSPHTNFAWLLLEMITVLPLLLSYSLPTRILLLKYKHTTHLLL
jgi:hypothetical protein